MDVKPHPPAKKVELGIHYPDIEVQLSDDTSGNAYLIIAVVRKAMRRAKVDDKEIEKFQFEATSGDYDNLLSVIQKWVKVT